MVVAHDEHFFYLFLTSFSNPFSKDLSFAKLETLTIELCFTHNTIFLFVEHQKIAVGTPSNNLGFQEENNKKNRRGDKANNQAMSSLK